MNHQLGVLPIDESVRQAALRRQSDDYLLMRVRHRWRALLRPSCKLAT